MNYTPYIAVRFLTELLLMTALFVLPCPRRPRFFLRPGLSLAVCYGASCLTSPLVLYYHRWAAPFSTIGAILRYILLFVLVSLAVYHVFSLSIRMAFFLSAGAYAVQHIAMKLYGLLEDLYRTRIPLAAVVLLYVVYLALYTAAAYFLLIRKLHREDTARLRADEMFLFNVLSVVSFIVLDQLSGTIAEDALLARLGHAGYGITCGVFLLFLQSNLFEKGAVLDENERTEFILEQERKRFEAFRNEAEYLNIKCHDLKHQVHRLKQAGPVAPETIAELEDSIAQYESYSRTGNAALDIILGEKVLACRAKHIEFNASVEGSLLSKLSESDIYSLFGNALDNAIEYEETLPEEQRLIRLAVKDVGTMLLIRVENVYAGPDLNGADPQTTKGDRNNHGFGIRSMRHIAEKYGGELSVQAREELFTLTFLFPF